MCHLVFLKTSMVKEQTISKFSALGPSLITLDFLAREQY